MSGYRTHLHEGEESRIAAADCHNAIMRLAYGYREALIGGNLDKETVEGKIGVGPVKAHEVELGYLIANRDPKAFELLDEFLFDYAGFIIDRK